MIPHIIICLIFRYLDLTPDIFLHSLYFIWMYKVFKLPFCKFKNIPILDHSLDFICALFTVVNQDELKRALKEDGYIVHVTANNQHLIEIKELIYDEIKVKSDKYIRLDFNLVKSYDFKEKVHISNREDALNLLMMTPHYYHIKKEKRGVLDTLQGLDITIDIKVTVYALL